MTIRELVEMIGGLENKKADLPLVFTDHGNVHMTVASRIKATTYRKQRILKLTAASSMDKFNHPAS